MAEEKFISKYTANEIESMLDKVKTDMRIIQYTQSEINTLLGKIDNMTQPTKISDLQDDSNFITNTVANLVNYYTKTQTYTKEEVNSLVSSSASGGFLVVESLPTTDISTHNIYLILSTSGKTKNLYDEYINIDGTANGWELIGSTKIDLTGYVTSTQLSTALADYLSTADFQNALTSYYTKAEVDNLIAQIDTSGSGSGGTSEKVPGNSLISRWLRFDPDNKRGVIIKAGTNIKLPNGSIRSYITDTHVDLTSYITQNGADYYLYIDNNGDISAYTSYQSTGNKIGRLHTLCADVGTDVTMIAPAPPSSGYTTDTDYLIKSYRQEKDPDFYAFYNKKVKSVTAKGSYDVVTVDHPLSGFQAGDILPESVFCLNWYPDTLFEDGMVYDKDTNKVIDIYLQSGTGHNTRSKYNQAYITLRQPYNHAEDMRMVGKRLLYDNEFTSAALGSNEQTCLLNDGNINGYTIGGHEDYTNRRMISAIGCEEMCGYLWQYLQEVFTSGVTNQSANNWQSTDGSASGPGTIGSFGSELGVPYIFAAGASYKINSFNGSRSRKTAKRNDTTDDCTGRGLSNILTMNKVDGLNLPSGGSSPITFGIEEGVYGYYNEDEEFIPFKTQADIDAAVSAVSSVGTATAAEVLEGYTFSNDDGTGFTGTMTNRGSVSGEFYLGSFYRIPKGYHDGTGTVTVKNNPGLTLVGSYSNAINVAASLLSKRGINNFTVINEDNNYVTTDNATITFNREGVYMITYQPYIWTPSGVELSRETDFYNLPECIINGNLNNPLRLSYDYDSTKGIYYKKFNANTSKIFSKLASSTATGFNNSKVTVNIGQSTNIMVGWAMQLYFLYGSGQ